MFLDVMGWWFAGVRGGFAGDTGEQQCGAAACLLSSNHIGFDAVTDHERLLGKDTELSKRAIEQGGLGLANDRGLHTCGSFQSGKDAAGARHLAVGRGQRAIWIGADEGGAGANESCGGGELFVGEVAIETNYNSKGVVFIDLKSL